MNQSPFLFCLQCGLSPLFSIGFVLMAPDRALALSRAESRRGEEQLSGRVPHHELLLLTALQDTCCDNHGQLLPWSRLGDKEQLPIHFLWQNKRWANIPMCKLLCKQNTASNPNSRVLYTKTTEKELETFSWYLQENVRDFILSCSKKRFWRKKNQRRGHRHR